MASRVLREFLEENDLTFENLRILKVDKNGDETELDSEELLYGLLNRIRHSNTDRSNRHKEIEKPIDLDEKDYDIPIPKKKFELGMMNKLNLGIELSSLSFAISIPTSIYSIEPNIDFVMLRYGFIQNGKFYKDADFDKYYKMSKRCKNLSIGIYIYITDLWNFSHKDIKNILDAAFNNRMKFDYPIVFDFSNEIVLDERASSSVRALIRMLNRMDILYSFVKMKDYNNIITVMYDYDILNKNEKYIVPNDILYNLDDISEIIKTRKGNIMSGYNLDSRGIVHCITRKGISEYIKENHLNGY